MLAANKGQRDIIRMFLTNGVPVESVDFDGKSALMLAARCGHVGEC